MLMRARTYIATNRDIAVLGVLAVYYYYIPISLVPFAVVKALSLLIIHRYTNYFTYQ